MSSEAIRPASQIISGSDSLTRVLELFPGWQSNIESFGRVTCVPEGRLILKKGMMPESVFFPLSGGLTGKWGFGLEEWVTGRPSDADFELAIPSSFLSVPSDLIREGLASAPELKSYLDLVFRYRAYSALDDYLRSNDMSGTDIGRIVSGAVREEVGLESGGRWDIGADKALVLVLEGDALIELPSQSVEYDLRQGVEQGAWFFLDSCSIHATAPLRLCVIRERDIPENLQELFSRNPLLRRAPPAIVGRESNIVPLQGVSVTGDAWTRRIDFSYRPASTLLSSTLETFRLYSGFTGMHLDCEALGQYLLLRNQRTPMVIAEALESQELFVKVWKIRIDENPLEFPFAIFLHNRVILVLAQNGKYWTVFDGVSGFMEVSWDYLGVTWDGSVLEMRDFRMPGDGSLSPGQRRGRVVRLVWSVVRQYRTYLWTFSALLAVVVALELALPKVMQYLFDRILPLREASAIWVVVSLIFTLGFFSIVARTAQQFVINEFTNRSNFYFSGMFYQRVVTASVRLFPENRIGEVVARMSEMGEIRRFLSTGAISSLVDLLMILSGTAMLFSYGLEFVLIPVGVFVSLVLGNIWFKKNYIEESNLLFKEEVKLDSFLAEMISSIQTIKANSVTRVMLDRWEAMLVSVSQKGFRLNMKLNHFNLLGSLVSGAGMVIGLFLGAGKVLNGSLTPGELVSLNLYLSMVRGPLAGLSGLVRDWENAKLSLDRVGEVLLAPGERVSTEKQDEVFPLLSGRVSFDRVTFRYRPDGPPVLDRVSFKVSPGEVVALVGPSGSGKTTIANLITGFYSAEDGSIELDGREIGAINLSALRSQVAYVNQDSKIFAGTISENIAYGDDAPDLNRIRWAANLSNCHEFVNALPNGYEYRLGEGGLGLSGGQRQRIALARALYRKNKVIILDEATSSLDSDSEGVVTRNLKEVFWGATAIVIAHRLSTVRNADRILFIDQGRVIEEGNHVSLMEKRGRYFEMVTG